MFPRKRVVPPARRHAVSGVQLRTLATAGWKSAVGVESLGGGFRPIQVTVEHHRTANLKPPNGFPVVWHRTAVVIEQPRLHAGEPDNKTVPTVSIPNAHLTPRAAERNRPPPF